MGNGEGECLGEAALDDSTTSGSDGNEWRQDALEHDPAGELIVLGAPYKCGEVLVALRVGGFVAKTCALECIIEMRNGCSW
jgi:hypothetical protein